MLDREKDQLLTLVREHNFEGVQNYLNARESLLPKDRNGKPIQVPLDPIVIDQAFYEFSQSDTKTMTNSQNIIGLLYNYAWDKDRKAEYLDRAKYSKDYKRVTELLELHERTVDHSWFVKGGTEVTQPMADEYSRKMGVFEERLSLYNEIDSDKKKSEFKRETILIINAEAKKRIGAVDLAKLENTGRSDYFSYVTGYSGQDLDSMLNEIIIGLPDKFFAQSWKGMRDARVLIIEELFSTPLDLNKNDDFVSFVYALMNKLITTIKDAAIIVSGPTKVDFVKVDPKNLSLDMLKVKLRTIKDPEQKSPEIKNFAANSKSYLDFLISKGELLTLDMEGLGVQELENKLAVLTEYIAVSNFINQALSLSPKSEVLKSINDFSYQHFNAEQLIKNKENIELALIKKLNGPEGEVVLPNGLTQRQRFAMQLFTEVEQGKRKLPDEQRKFVQDFIKNAIGNTALINLHGRGVVDGFSSFSVETKDLDTFLSAYKKLKQNYDNISNNKPINDQDKVGLGEYAVLMRYAKKVDIFKTFHKLGMLEGDKTLNEIYQAIQENAEIIKELNTQISMEMQYESGDLIIQSITREAQLKNVEIDTMKKLALLLGDNLHTGKLVANEGSVAKCYNVLFDIQKPQADQQYKTALSNALKKYDITFGTLTPETLGDAINKHHQAISGVDNVQQFMTNITEHIEKEIPNYLIDHPELNPLEAYNSAKFGRITYMSHLASWGMAKDELSVFPYLYSDIYHIKVEKLINSEYLEALETKYGKEYVDVVNAKYREIENEFHQSSNEKFKQVVLADMTRGFRAGLSDLIPPFGHSKFKPDDLNKLHDKIKDGVKEKTEMTCSEFAARTTAAAFIELNNQLKEELGIADPDKNVIDVSFLAKERFSKVHPTRLIEILESKGCIEKAPRTKTEQQYISFAAKVSKGNEGRQDGRT